MPTTAPLMIDRRRNRFVAQGVGVVRLSAKNVVDASSNQSRFTAGNLQGPHGSRSATISPPGDDGGEC
jgi:hypothetical protein